MISDARNFFNGKIKALFPRLKEGSDYFDGDEQSWRKVKNTYVYEFTGVTPVEDDKQCFKDSLPVQITFFHEAKTKTAEVLEAASNGALELRRICCREKSGIIKQVNCTGIEFDTLTEYSDKQIKLTINFNLVIVTGY